MKIFNIFKHNNDDLKFDFFKKHGLEKWWQSEFTADEREYIKSESSMLLDSRYNFDKSPAEILYLLAGYVNTKNTKGHQYLAQLLLEKAVQLADDPLILFIIYSQLIKLYFEHRNDAEEIRFKVIELCKKQINLSEEVLNLLKKNELSEKITEFEHEGYQKLALLNIEDGESEKAEELLTKAKAEGWTGNWDKLELKLT
ncbi:MAG: hypothetical protein ACOCQE_03525 [Halanaerobium sp.]